MQFYEDFIHGHMRDDAYRQDFRMSSVSIDELLENLRPELTKSTTNFRDPLDPRMMLAATLYKLARDSCDFHTIAI